MLYVLDGPNPVEECTLIDFRERFHTSQIRHSNSPLNNSSLPALGILTNFTTKIFCITWQGILATEIVEIIFG